MNVGVEIRWKIRRDGADAISFYGDHLFLHRI